MSKYYRIRADKKVDGKTTCPVCGRLNNHKRTVDTCNHVYKITAKGEVWYYWDWRLEEWKCESSNP